MLLRAKFIFVLIHHKAIQCCKTKECIVYQVSSRCESYKLTLDIFKSYKVSSSFFQALDTAVRINDWTAFISQYGTHYVTEVLFGGRAIQESEFNRNSVAKLKEKGIDVGRSVKAGFAGFYTDASVDVSVSSQQKNEVESVRKKVTIYYVGGVAPRSGTILDWQTKVNQQPMPISYSLLPISDLFVLYSQSKGADWVVNAKQSFYKALNAYCIGKCTYPQPDKPLPKVTKSISAYNSPTYGGNGGNFYSWNQLQPDWHVVRVRIRSGSEVDGIQLFTAHKDVHHVTLDSGYYGGWGGYEHIYNVQPGDWINRIDIRAGSRIDSLAFYTRRNPNPSKYGGNGGVGFTVTPPSEQYRWTGIVGSSGMRLDRICFIFSLTVSNLGHTHHITKAVYPEKQK